MEVHMDSPTKYESTKSTKIENYKSTKYKRTKTKNDKNIKSTQKSLDIANALVEIVWYKQVRSAASKL